MSAVSPTMQAICRRLGRRPHGDDELTDEERQALRAELTEHRGASQRPIERRG